MVAEVTMGRSFVVHSVLKESSWTTSMMKRWIRRRIRRTRIRRGRNRKLLKIRARKCSTPSSNLNHATVCDSKYLEDAHGNPITPHGTLRDLTESEKKRKRMREKREEQLRAQCDRRKIEDFFRDKNGVTRVLTRNEY